MGAELEAKWYVRNGTPGEAVAMANLKLRLVLVGGVAFVGLSSVWACSSDDSGSGGNTGGTTGAGGGAAKTCGATKVAPGCATFDASLEKGFCKACHTKEGAKAFKTIDFITDPKGSMVGKTASYGDLGAVVKAPMCPATREVLLDPNDFDKSLFVTKIRGTGFACGDKMPQSLGDLKPADLSCLLSWACELNQK